MIALLANELLRFWCRRAVRVAGAIVLAGMAIGAVATFATHDDEMPDLQGARRDAQARYEECRSSAPATTPGVAGVAPDMYYCGTPDSYAYEWLDPRFCAMDMLSTGACALVPTDVRAPARFSDLEPEPQDVRPGGFGDSDPGAGSSLGKEPRGHKGWLSGVVGLVLVVVVVVAASFVGGEYRAGTVESVLVVEPRRWRVYTARLAAGALSCAALVGILLGALILFLVPTIAWRGAPSLPGFWPALASSVGRAMLAAALVSLVVMAVTTLSANTVGGVAGVLGYMIVSALTLQFLLQGREPLEWTRNVISLVTGGDVARRVPISSFGPTYYADVAAHGPGVAALVAAAYSIVLVLLAGAVFVRRDVA